MKFSEDCELFSAPPLCKGAQGECRKPGYAPPPSTNAAPVHRARAESEGEGEGSRVRSAFHTCDAYHAGISFNKASFLSSTDVGRCMYINQILAQGSGVCIKDIAQHPHAVTVRYSGVSLA